MMVPLFPALFLILVQVHLFEAERLNAFLLFEDQEQDVCTSRKCMNFLTLKKKMYEKEKTMEDFTICFRLNLLSYRGKDTIHHILRAKTTKYAKNMPENREWMTGYHFQLNPRDDMNNGVLTIHSFNEYLAVISGPSKWQ